MGKSLIIAEKPSVAADIARALGGFKKEGDFFESDEYVLSSAVGHLVELCLPGELDKKKGKWSLANLPIIPDQFALKPIEKTEARFKLLKKLIARKDVNMLINACDAGREGELIFRYLVKMVDSKKAIQRLWLQSMTPQAIRDGFKKLRPGQELEPLAAAAVCRSESDWLVGINGTRALTAFNSKGGGFHLTPVGRVQTPTLSVVVERDLAIKHFVSHDYWELHATFGAKAGTYLGRWFREAKAQQATDAAQGSAAPAEHKAERLWKEDEARAIAARCLGKPGIVTEETKPATQLSPLLFDLTTLQRECNSRFGLSAKRTLQIAQALYEKHKVITYPRTDSRYLPEDYINPSRDVLRVLQEGPLEKFASKILEAGWVKPNKRIFNNAKVSDHFAIIPTAHAATKLDEIEQKIYDTIAKRFMAVFYPAAQFEVTTRITHVEGEAFKTEGKVLREPGWLAIYGREEQSEEDQSAIVPVSEGEKVDTQEVEVRGLQTKPPARYTEATLLSAMENAGKLVEDEELREAMGAKGLGTPATRAAIIEGLLNEEYLRREGRELSASPKAFSLMELLEAIDIEALRSPEMTGEWEHKLKQMERGQLSRSVFMKEIEELTATIVGKTKNFTGENAVVRPLGFNAPEAMGGGELVETLRDYQTRDGKFTIRKVIAGRLIEPEELRQLLEKGLVGPLSGFRSRLGRPFAAGLKLAAEGEGKVEFVFDQSPVDGQGQPQDFSTQEPIGVCPVDGAKVYEAFMSFGCEHAFTKPQTCQFKIGKKILNQEITREQVVKLLTDKKTDLLTRFVSQRTKRPFSAYLVLKEDGKIGFEFPPRAERKGSKKGKGKGAAASKPSKKEDTSKEE